jgi:serine/threonine protein kinase/Tfp pilus assembly protein PilF
MTPLNCSGCGRLLPPPSGDGTVSCPSCGSAQSDLATNPEALKQAQDLERWLLGQPSVDSLATAPPTPLARPVPLSNFSAPAGYDILGELGRGGMGIVYLARQARLGRVVALKMVLRASLAGSEEHDRFQSEAEAVARLQHPNIVQIHEVGEHDGSPFMALEYCAGGSLAARLAGSPLEPRPAADLVAVLARAMHAAHQARVIHRDLKPANVLLSYSGGSQNRLETPPARAGERPLNEVVPKISDFGLAKMLDADRQATVSGAILGTPSYMAPEQARGRVGEIGPATDVYALGAILYECLTGRPPFRAASTLETVGQVLGSDPVPLRTLQPRTPIDLETICLKCLQKDSSKRYPSADELAADLTRFLDGVPILARPVGPLERAGKWARRNPGSAALIAAGVLFAFTLVGLLVGFNASLRDAVRTARQAEKQAQQERAESLLTAEIEGLLRRGDRALAAGNLDAARSHFDTLVEKAAASASLRPRRNEARKSLARIDALRSRREARAAALARFRRFQQRRDQALYRWSSFALERLAGLAPDPSATNRRSARMAAFDALGVFGIPRELHRAPRLDPSLTEGERNSVRAACYDCLLILADLARTSPPSRQRLLAGGQYLGVPADLQRWAEGGSSAREPPELGRLPQVWAGLALFWQGARELQAGRSSTAALRFAAALRHQPDHYWAHFFLALCRQEARPSPATLATVTTFLSRPEPSWFLYFWRSLIYQALGDFAHARDDLRQALARVPDAASRYPLHVAEGVLHLRARQYPAADEALRKAITLRPNAYQAHANLAEVHRQQGRLEAALAELNQAVRLEPQLSLLFRARAELQRQRGQMGPALDDLDRAIRREGSPERQARDQIHRGSWLLAQKRFPEAVTAFREAGRLAPGNPEAHRRLAAALLAPRENSSHRLAEFGRAKDPRALANAATVRRYQEVVAAVGRYLLHGPPVPEVYRLRARAWAGLHRYPEAVEDYTRALAFGPADSSTLCQRGWLYLLAGRSPKLAVHDFRKAIRLDPHSAEAHAGCGNALAQMGQFATALEHAERAVRCLRDSSINQRMRHRVLYTSARVYATASQTERSPGRSLRDQRAAQEKRAVELLQQSLRSLPAAQASAFWREVVMTDPAWTALRSSPAFRRVQNQARGR